MRLPPYSNYFTSKSMYFHMFKTSTTPHPSLRVRINQGEYWLNNAEQVEYAGGISPIFIVPTSNAKWCLLTINQNGYPNIIYGATSANPEPPECRSGSLPIAWVYLESTDTKITRKNLFDARPFMQAHKHFSAKSLMEQGGTGIPTFEFTSAGKAKMYSFVAGEGITIQQLNPYELQFDVAVDIGFENITLLDMGYFID